MTGRTRAWPLLVAAVAVLASGAAVGFIFGERSIPEEEQELILRASRIVSTLLEWLPEEKEPSEIVYDGIDGMLEVLDPHSNYLDPSTFRSMRARQEGSFFGVGIIISVRNGKITVIAPMAGTPAASKGLRAGDVISAVEDESTEDMTLNDVVDRVRGPEGTEVRLTIDRPGMAETFDVTITRTRIPTNSVRFAFMIRPAVGYIRLSEFSNTSSREIQEATETLAAEGMTQLILDLRNNPGGPLDAAIGVTDPFLREGQLIVTTRGRTPESNASLDAPGHGIRYEGPLIVLVNEGSASASEIVAGAVQDHDRGLVVGDVTWGKGLVQTVFGVRDTGLALTTARYYTPSGRCIQRDYDSYIDYITHRNGTTADDESERYETDSGRTVLGGGGVTPDVVVENRELTENVVRLYGNSAFFRYAVELRKPVPEEEQLEVASEFEADDEVLQAFCDWLLAEEILTEDQVTALLDDPVSLEDAGRAIHVELLNATAGLEAGYRVGIEADQQFHAALEHLEDAADFWEAWQADEDAG